MATFESFEEIEAWKRARRLVQEIYEISNEGSFCKDFGLRDQTRKAAVSILSNIAEGFERGGSGEFQQFLSVAKGSTGEVRAQLYVALDQGYINQETFERLVSRTNEIAGMISKLMSYLRSTNLRGTKYK